MARMTLGIALKRLESEASGGVVSLEHVRRVAEILACDNTLLSACCGKMERDCLADFTARRYASLRRNYFGRAVAKPLAGLLNSGLHGLERSHLPQFFAALRLILGNETYEQLCERAERTADNHRGKTGCVEWEPFYEDETVKEIMETVLVALARAFDRFEMRQDWLLTVMNQKGYAGLKFNLDHLYRLLSALFAPERLQDYLAPSKQTAFTARWGETPERVFASLLTGLERLGRRLGG
jgi:hypothetical protein